MVGKIGCVFLCVVSCRAQAALHQGGTVTGTLTGADGKTISGGYVSLHLSQASAQGRHGQTDWATIAGTGGAFRFTGLSEGRFRLCAQVPKTAWLNPCEWGLQPPVVSLSATQPAVSVTMVLKIGAVVPIRVEDPGQFLSQNEGKIPGAHLLMGVADDGHAFRTVSLLSQDASGRNSQIVVPFGSAAKLVVFSSFFHLADDQGRPLAQAVSYTVPLTVPAGQQPAPIKLTVTGGGH